MINRELAEVEIMTFNTTLDSYGQQHKAGCSTRSAEMIIKVNSQTNINDPRFVDAEYVGITTDKAVKAGEEVVSNGTTYLIMTVVPTTRLYRVGLKKK